MRLKKIEYYNFEKGYGWLEGKEKIRVKSSFELNCIKVALATGTKLSINHLGWIDIEKVLFVKKGKGYTFSGVDKEMTNWVKNKLSIDLIENLSMCVIDEVFAETIKKIQGASLAYIYSEEYEIIKKRMSDEKWHKEQYACYSNWDYEKPAVRKIYDDINDINNNNYKTQYRYKDTIANSLKELEEKLEIKPTKVNHSHTDNITASYDLLSD